MKKSELKQLIKEAIIEQEDIDVSNFARVNPDTLKKQINDLLTKLSPEGQEILRHFVKGAVGWNRSSIIAKLHSVFFPKAQSISKSELRSYSNTELYDLINTGDLIKKDGKYFANI